MHIISNYWRLFLDCLEIKTVSCSSGTTVVPLALEFGVKLCTWYISWHEFVSMILAAPSELSWYSTENVLRGSMIRTPSEKANFLLDVRHIYV